MGIESVVDAKDKKVSGHLTVEMCSTCGMTVVWMQNQLRLNETQDPVVSYVNDLCSRWHCPMGESAVDCAGLFTMLSVSFTLGGRVFDLSPEQYVLKVGGGDLAQCISGFTALDVPPPRGPL
ncbi:aspartic proteinase-like [Rhodamnia argentea]|uniref:Aspartic proteinase-like n=1 Tax=Rhodamnia argentea TaxID=178133 RepID=A0ABM3H176_9MYRT|nr:aspartic proteinase-like [Rhodamnia argentea]